jgi:hypothetical protein
MYLHAVIMSYTITAHCWDTRICVVQSNPCEIVQAPGRWDKTRMPLAIRAMGCWPHKASEIKEVYNYPNLNMNTIYGTAFPVLVAGVGFLTEIPWSNRSFVAWYNAW